MNTDNMKNMPFRETEEYVDNLIADKTEMAIIRHKQRGVSMVVKICEAALVGVAASVVLVLVLCLGGIISADEDMAQHAENVSDSPLEEFLADISDADAKSIICYDVEEISEY